MVFLIALAHFAAGLAAVMAVNQLGLFRWRRSASAHWTERARLLWPARVTAVTNLFLLPVILLFLSIALDVKNEAHALPNVLCAGLGVFLGSYPFDRALFPRFQFRLWLHQSLAAWGMRGGLLMVLAVACIYMPTHFGWAMIAVVAGYLLFYGALHWGLFLKYLRWVGLLKPANERLQRIVDQIATRTGSQTRATWQLESILALAYAFPTTGDLIFSRRLLEIASDDEISAVAAHELAHLSESKIILAGRLLGSLTLFPMIFVKPLYHNWGAIGLAAALLVMLSIMMFARRLSMRMEKRADTAAVNDQAGEGVYARALEKLYQENLLPAVNAANRATHPHLYDRMLAAGITPDYPRPAKPKRFSPVGTFLYALFGFLIGVLVMRG
jgi:Zn-dependent protease with chaperone function